MGDGQLADGELDAILALQFLVAWAGEGLCQPKRLDWWRTDLLDEDGGGYFFQALFPKTHPWAAFETVRKAAIQHDRQTRLNMADPDSIRTLFFWGFHLDDRLAQHKRNEHQVPPEAALSLPMNLHDPFAKADFELAIQSSHRPVPYNVVPEGREIVEAIPASKELYARNLAATLLPLADLPTCGYTPLAEPPRWQCDCTSRSGTERISPRWSAASNWSIAAVSLSLSV